MVKVASFNVQNLFSRPRVFRTNGWQQNSPIFAAYHAVNALLAQPEYDAATKTAIRDHLLTLELYVRNDVGAIRKNATRDPKWAWMRKNRGTFDREPKDRTQDVEIVATGRAEWTGWVELATEAVNEVGTRTTAQVIHELGADILAIVEAEDRPALVRFNEELLGGLHADPYRHVMLVDGNDDRGIDVGLMTRENFRIESIRSNVDTPDPDTAEPLFSRDCAEYTVTVPGGLLYVLVNHFKSQSGGGDRKRQRQSEEVRRIVDAHVAAGHDVVVLGDFNEGQKTSGQPPTNLPALFDPAGPLRSAWDLQAFADGGRPGTFDDCSIRNRLDYILVSDSLAPKVTAGGVFRCGLWGDRKTRPTAWATYPEMTSKAEQASDHAAIWIDLAL